VFLLFGLEESNRQSSHPPHFAKGIEQVSAFIHLIEYEYIGVAKARVSSIFIPPQEDTCELSTNIEVPEDFKVEDVTIPHHGQPRVGTLYLTPHHLIFRIDPEAESSSQSASRTPPPQTKPVKRSREIWITYPIVSTLFLYPASAGLQAHLRLRNRDISFLTFQFKAERECRDVFESIKALAIVNG
jgi:hypothetical protein